VEGTLAGEPDRLMALDEPVVRRRVSPHWGVDMLPRTVVTCLRDLCVGARRVCPPPQNSFWAIISRFPKAWSPVAACS
jgi:hypothetical protein